MSEQNKPAGVYEAQQLEERGQHPLLARENQMLRDLLKRLWEWSNLPELEGVFVLASVHGFQWSPESLAIVTKLWQEVKAIVEKEAQ